MLNHPWSQSQSQGNPSDPIPALRRKNVLISPLRGPLQNRISSAVPFTRDQKIDRFIWSFLTSPVRLSGGARTASKKRVSWPVPGDYACICVYEVACTFVVNPQRREMNLLGLAWILVPDRDQRWIRYSDRATLESVAPLSAHLSSRMPIYRVQMYGNTWRAAACEVISRRGMIP